MPVMRQPNEIYAEARESFLTLVRSLDERQLATKLERCPEWTVRDVAAHITGLVAESLARVPPPLGSDEATARQVSARAGMTLGQICDEWTSYADDFDAFVRADPAWGVGLVGDLVVHTHDVQESLGLPIGEHSEALAMAADRYVERLQQRAGQLLGLAITVDLGDAGVREPTLSNATSSLTLRTTPYEFLRHVTGRRSRAQVAALDWSADPSHLLDQAWVQYGRLV